MQLITLIVAMGVAAGLLRSPFVKGWWGEFQVNAALRLFLSRKRYHLIKNITVRSDNGTTQIDHIIVSAYGLFVIETKNMSGWIFGTDRDSQWTQKFRRKSFQFQNPLRQNFKHAAVLSEVLGLRRGVIKSVVVFVGSARFKRQVPANVTNVGGCIRYIASCRETLLTDGEVHRVLELLKSVRLDASFRTHRDHVRLLRNRLSTDKKNHARKQKM